MTEEIKEEKKKLVYSVMLSKEYHPMKIKELAGLLGVPKKEGGDFHEVINALEAEGKIRFDKSGKLLLSDESTIVGKYLGTKRGFGFVSVEGEKEDIYIPIGMCKDALHGDKVQVHLFDKAIHGKSKEGEVVRVVERGTSHCVGTFSPNKNFAFVIPDNEKLGKDIYISKSKTLGAVKGHKVVVNITDYGNDTKNPEGEIVEIIGHINDPGVDILSVIKGYDLPTEFPEAVMREAAKLPEEIDENEYGGRLNLCDLPTVTIDGEDAKDLDDAITLSRTDEGYRLGVHIADVAEYVKENSPLDKEAHTRGTSVYLVDRVIPMLPHKLSNGICSLNAGTKRLALSCIMDIDQEGKVTGHKIAETLICVDRRMSYTDVNKILTLKDEETCKEYADFVPMFELMKELAHILRKKRKKKGSIDFDFAESKIKLDDEGHPISIETYERNVATRLIEEFMLMANQVVAEDYFWMEIPFLYRTHESPDLEKIKELVTLVRGFGHHLKVGNEEVHPKEIQKLISEIEGTPEEAFISRLTLRSMKRAKYEAENNAHFGLAMQYYSHFTSPIRRYPDLQIHRIIKENLHGQLKEKRREHFASILPDVAKETSDAERRADDAERDVEKMKKAEYMAGFIGESFDGVISGVTNWGIYVELANTVEGMIRVADLTDDYYKLAEEEYAVIGEHSLKSYRLGEKIKVTVARVDRIASTIDFVPAIEEE